MLMGNFVIINFEVLFYVGKAGMGIIVIGYIMIKEELK